jgi:hypothetical protein
LWLWYAFRVVLALPFPYQEIVITAAPLFRELAADGGPGFINSAAASLFAEKAAGGIEDRIALMAKQQIALIIMFTEALDSSLERYLIMRGYTAHIRPRYSYLWICAAICGTDAAVKKDLHLPFSLLLPFNSGSGHELPPLLLLERPNCCPSI